MTSKECEAEKDSEACRKLDVELRDADLKLKMMEDCMKRVMDAGRKAAAAFLELVEASGELRRVIQKRNEFEGRRKELEMEPESGRRLICLNTMLVKQARMDKMLRGVIEQSVDISHGLINRLGGY